MTIHASNYPLPSQPPDKKAQPGWNPEAALAALERVQAALPEAVVSVQQDWGQVWAVVELSRVCQVLGALRDDSETPYEVLMDLSCVDYLEYPQPAAVGSPPERFAVHYVLSSYTARSVVRVKAWVPEADPRVPTAVDLWPAAGWAEREAAEMYGVVFDGNPDLRKLLLPEGYQGHPLRKDYPLRGRGERENFPRYTTREDA